MLYFLDWGKLYSNGNIWLISEVLLTKITPLKEMVEVIEGGGDAMEEWATVVDYFVLSSKYLCPYLVSYCISCQVKLSCFLSTINVAV